MKFIFLAVAAMCAVVVAGVGLAQDSGDANTIYACKHPSGGWLRQVGGPGQCRRREKAVTWNIAGEKGAPGEPGPAGPAGAKGDKGDKGDPGTAVTGLGTLRGVPCVASDEAAGEIEVTVAGNGDVALACVAAPDSPPPPPPPPPAEPAKLVINEVDYDQVGTDGNGFVEIKNTGGSAADLSTVDLVAVNGGDSAEYDRVALTGSLTAGAHLDVAIELQNGAPDGLALLDGMTLLDALSYEGAITTATIGTQTYNLVEGTALAAEDSNTVAGSLIRNPDGKDTGDASADWAFTTTITRGAANVMTP
jgi:hypothetical protein